ncbi:LppP/LprE family lipoprotein [Nocardia yunnanensis]|uniref:LppP/LprE family lipoprotein n=2 Tax=Nocardia yunnanensis TaxID=2382165 RepID=A0A386ZQ95_9NOCA|nr:LppP/LprE family lipoprotein [Nocardia yunnanensis]
MTVLAVGVLSGCGSSGAPESTTAESAQATGAQATAGTTTTGITTTVVAADQPCKPDSSAIRNAAAGLAPAQVGQGKPYQWATPAVGAKTTVNDICSTLSAYLISVEGGTASSPMQVLLFHRGGFVGTAEPNWNTFITPDPNHTTDSTVGLRYKVPGSCDACADGTFYCVQFRWDGSGVQMIGRPPELVGTTETPGTTKC